MPRFQFSLKTVLLVVTAICLSLGIVPHLPDWALFSFYCFLVSLVIGQLGWTDPPAEH